MSAQISAHWEHKLAELARWERSDGLFLAHLKAKRDELQARMDRLNTSINALESLIQDRRTELKENILICVGIMGDTNIHPLVTYTHEDVLVYDHADAKHYAEERTPWLIRTSLDRQAFETALHNRDPKLDGFNFKLEQKPVIVLGDFDYLADTVKEGDK